MPMSTDVVLPRASSPRFPDACVSCDDDPEENTWRLSARTSSWISLFGIWIGRKHTVEVPCCRECQPRITKEKRVRDWSNIACMVAVCIVLIPMLDGFDRPYRKFVLLGGLLLALLPRFLYEVFRPPAFDIFVRPKTVDYEFLDADLAEGFYELNEDQGANIEY